MNTRSSHRSPTPAVLRDDVRAVFPCLRSVTPALEALAAGAGPLVVPSGTRLFAEHEPCKGFPLVLAG